MDSPKILCGASYYEQSFYLNEAYNNLPQLIKDELKIMCVLFVDEVSGIIMLEFDDGGNLRIITTHKDSDFYYDEIGSELKVQQLQREKEELFEQLEQYYKAVINK